MKTRYEIKLYKEAPQCPQCKVSMQFTEHKTKPWFDKYGGGIEYTGWDYYLCPKCYNTYLVNDLSEEDLK